jgi:hypothetical protein
MRRGGWIALIVVVVLLSLMGGSYALGRSSSDPAATTVSAQPAAGTSSPRMMTWAQRHTDDVSWMRTHQADVRWMRTHGDDVRWMRNNADTCDWGLPRSRARYWMRTDPNAARPAPRSDNGSGWSTGHRDWMHKGWHDNYQRR